MKSKTPIYILHLSDFHFKDDETIAKLDLLVKKGERKIGAAKELLLPVHTEGFINQLRQFLKLRKRSYFDFLCITGDMMDRNGMNENHDKAVNFIKEVQDGVLAKPEAKESFTFCCPGNHDICTKSVNEFNLSKKDLRLRAQCLENSTNPNTKLIDNDDNRRELTKCFSDYNTFVEKIGANVNKEDKLDPLYGYWDISLASGVNIMFSWFNTSWLCHTKGQWIDLLGMTKYFKNSYPKGLSDIKKRAAAQFFYDDFRISAGDKIHNAIYRRFEHLKSNENGGNKLFSIALAHHHPRRLSDYDKVDTLIKRKGANKSIYHFLSQQSLVCNGHTHSELFDEPFCTSTTPHYKKVEPVVTIYEVDLINDLITLHGIKIKTNIHANKTKTIVNPRPRNLFVYNSTAFLKKFKSNYSSNDLLSDLAFNSEKPIGSFKTPIREHEKLSISQKDLLYKF